MTALAERLGAPVLTSGGGRGTLAEDHPLCLGAISDQTPVPDLVAEADVVLAVGTRFQAGPTRRWATRIPGRLLHLDVDPAVIGLNYEADVALVGESDQLPFKLYTPGLEHKSEVTNNNLAIDRELDSERPPTHQQSFPTTSTTPQHRNHQPSSRANSRRLRLDAWCSMAIFMARLSCRVKIVAKVDFMAPNV